MERREADAWNSWEDLILVSSIKRNGLDAVDKISADVQMRAQTRPPVFFTTEECLRRFEILRQKCLAISKTFGDKVVHEISIQFMKEELTKIQIQELKEGIEADDREIRKLEKILEFQRRALEGKNTELEVVNEVKEEEEEAGQRLAAEDVVMVEVNVKMDSRRRLTTNEVVIVEEIKEDEISKILAVKEELEEVMLEETGIILAAEEVVVLEEAGRKLTANDVVIVERNRESRQKNEVEKSACTISNYNLRSCKRETNKPEMTNEMIKKKMHQVIRRLEMHKSSNFLFYKLDRGYLKDSELYKKIIRQPVTFEDIQSRINQEEEYTSSFDRFFRDLLLLINNAIVFFKKDSEEHSLALQLRSLIKEEMAKIVETA